MINFMELGTTTFEDGIAGGMEPGDVCSSDWASMHGCAH